MSKWIYRGPILLALLLFFWLTGTSEAISVRETNYAGVRRFTESGLTGSEIWVNRQPVLTVWEDVAGYHAHTRGYQAAATLNALFASQSQEVHVSVTLDEDRILLLAQDQYLLEVDPLSASKAGVTTTELALAWAQNLNDVLSDDEGAVSRHIQDIHKGKASWYGGYFHGRRTASGETYNQHALTAAHRTLPFGTVVLVTNTSNQRSVLVRINDRGPFIQSRIIDLSRRAAEEIGMIRSGTAQVTLQILQTP
jgi:rare lipoprotein A